MGSAESSARLSFRPAYVWQQLEKTVRVDDRVRKCTVFIGVERGGRFIPYGTGFIVGLTFDDVQFTFLVTAEHVLADIDGEDFAIRVNAHDGNARSVPQSKKQLWRAKDEKTDVVLVSIVLEASIYDFLALPLNRAHWDERRKNIMEPAVGVEVAIAGLYTSHFGQLKNIPVVRIGHIAAMPEEKVLTHRGYVDGYLIEVNSIAGLSGSPVYLNVPPIRVVGGGLQFFSGLGLLPLGILTGYHVTSNKDDQFVVPKFQPLEGDKLPVEEESKEERRTGFAVVVPFEVLLDWAESEQMQKLFKQSVEIIRAESGFKPASSQSSSPTKIGVQKGKEAFNSLLNAAARKLKTDD
jgi:hypothetical protein